MRWKEKPENFEIVKIYYFLTFQKSQLNACKSLALISPQKFVEF